VRVGGLDLALTASGLAVIDGGSASVVKLKPPGKLKGHSRLQWWSEQIAEWAADLDLIAIEGPSYGSPGEQHSTGTVAVIPPACLKKYATGSGAADKFRVFAAARDRYPGATGVTGPDEADALVLAAMFADYAGVPLAPVPAAQRAVLSSVVASGRNKGKPSITWPALPGRAA
jgi:hypothetical protein